jgi:hypothetical protein
VATNGAGRRTANDADYIACLTWSAAQHKNGKTSGRRLREDAPTWCRDNGVIYGKREDWEAWLPRLEHLWDSRGRS